MSISKFQLSQDEPKKSFEVRPIRDGDESHVCRLLGGDTSKIAFNDPRHPVNETAALIEASRNPNAKGGGWVAIADGKPVGIITTKDFDGGIMVDEKYRRMGIAEALVGAREEFQRSQGQPKATAHIRADNAASIKLHEKLGYSTAADLDRTPGDSVVVFNKPLGQQAATQAPAQKNQHTPKAP